ncbi:PREDICTED: uncharacterized protein LOC106745908 [Dinoponera quadriceps]|uniref:Uncharacterized protein LOC106745908 n=1 Tax=Dinoponera quadriceps TaxID=609295 RepID=A0A6P3XG48_DINQU|nr:PREDICTED: uncharacterized protein LOC106745908 [Dinoponera quadriceps]
MAISIKFTKFDNTPWGFRLAGGSDFPQPLAAIRVTEGSLAECMGLKVGDVVVRLNDQPISCLTHGQAHEALLHAGNNFVLGVQREEEARKAAEAISEENIVPYKIALADLPPLFPEQILKEETVIERYEEETVEQAASAEDEVRREGEKLAEEKPVDADSEIVPNKNLTDDEIAQLILEEEELLSDQGLLGVNFKKLRPRAPALKGSKVLEELQHIATAEPELVQELKRTSTFLQRPQRPVPKPKSQPDGDDGETYRVVIKKQDKKTVIARLVEKGLLPPGTEIPRTPEPPYEVKMHEMKNNLEEDSLESSPNPMRSTLPYDTAEDSLSSRSPEPDDTLSLEAPPISAMSHIYDSKSLGTRSSSHRASVNKFPKKSRLVVSRRTRMKGKYLATYLSRESTRLMSLLTTLFHFLRKRDASEPNKTLEVHKRRLSLKGRYLEHVLQKNVTPVLQRLTSDSSVLYVEPEWREGDPSLRESLPIIVDASDNEEKTDEGACNILEYDGGPVSSEEGSYEDLSSSQVTDQVPEEEGSLSKLLQSTENYISTEVFHRGSRRLSKPRKSIVDTTEDAVPKEDDSLSKMLKSTEDYLSTEVFHRGSRRLSKPRKSIVDTTEDAVPKEDDSLSKMLKSTEDYLSTEVFHRGSRRLSKPRKSIVDTTEDAVPKEDDSLSKMLKSTEDYLSTEVFHRGSRRLSKPRKSIVDIPEDVVPKEDDSLSKMLKSTEDYISTEVFHRGSRRLSKPRKSIVDIPEDVVPKEDDSLSKMLKSTEDYISTEVFHRGSRRLSRRLSKDAGMENGALSDLLRSTGDYVSSEVFHRKSRRLSRSSKKDIPFTGPIWWGGLKNMCLSLPWFSLRVTEDSAEDEEICSEKFDPELDHENRRLSFVPTILYQGLTNRIGVDFTRLVAYAFVPCTSIVLLYLYKFGTVTTLSVDYSVLSKRQNGRIVCTCVGDFGSGKTGAPTTPEPTCKAEREAKPDSRPASKAEGEEKSELDERKTDERSGSGYNEEEDHGSGASAQDETAVEEDSSVSERQATAETAIDSEKIKELVTTEINLEKQLENVQRQLLALKRLPSEIENHLRIVSEQLHAIMELSGVRSLGNGSNGQQRRDDSSEEDNARRRANDEERKEQEEDTDEADEEFTETYDYIEEIACLERKTSSRSTPQVIEPSDDEGEMEDEEEEAETKEMDGMISVKSEDEEGSRVKKFIVSYETKLLKSPSPAPSHGSIEPDPKLSPKDQVIQELQQKMSKKGRKQPQDLWPQAKQLELTRGRRWRCPNDFFNDEMIAEVLSSQAEVIRGRALGVNFKKYEKTNLPNFDHLMNSSVYKMIHKMEREPKKGIPARPAKVNAAEDIMERVKSPALSVVDDRSTRSVSH